MAGLIFRNVRLSAGMFSTMRYATKKQLGALSVTASSVRTFATAGPDVNETDAIKRDDPIEAIEAFRRETNMHTNTSADKVVLVKAGMYKSAEEVPDRVPIAQIKKARDYMRVRVTLWMLGLTLGGCVAMIYYGRHLRDSGDSLDKRELARQAKLRQGN